MWLHRSCAPVSSRLCGFAKNFQAALLLSAPCGKERSFHDEQFEYACWNAWMFDLDGVAWGEPNFSADNRTSGAEDAPFLIYLRTSYRRVPKFSRRMICIGARPRMESLSSISGTAPSRSIMNSMS